MMPFPRDISKSIIQYSNRSIWIRHVDCFFLFFYLFTKFSLSTTNLSFSRRWIMLVRFRVGFISNFFPLFPMYLLDRGYFEGTKSTSQQVLLSDEQDPKLKLGCLFSLLFMLLVHTLITSSFSQDIHSFASSWKRTVKSFRKCFRMFDSTAVLSVILKILKFNFQLRIVVKLLSRKFKIRSKNVGVGIRIIRIWKNSSNFIFQSNHFCLFSFNENSTRLSSSRTTGYHFLFAANSYGKKEKQASREFRGGCGEPVEFSSVKSLSGLRFRCAFCGPATCCQT